MWVISWITPWTVYVQWVQVDNVVNVSFIILCESSENGHVFSKTKRPSMPKWHNCPNIISAMWFLFQDILENEDLHLDDMFIASLVFDLIKVVLE